MAILRWLALRQIKQESQGVQVILKRKALR